MTAVTRAGEWVFRLYRNGLHHADRRVILRDAKMARDAIAQWKRKGYKAEVLRKPEA